MDFDISIIIPCLNEEESIGQLVEAVNTYIATLSSLKCEVIYVDDGSTDNTFQLLTKAKHRNYTAKVIKFSRNFGSHAALYAGINIARGNYTTYLAADLQYPLEVVGQLYRKCLEGYDLVRLERDKTEDPFMKRVLSKGYAALIRAFAVKDYPRNGFDIVMFNHKIRKELSHSIEPHSSILLHIISLGYKMAAISCEKQKRKIGKSRWTFWKNIKLLIDSFVSFSYAPIRLVSLIGFIFLGLGIMYGAAALMGTGLGGNELIIFILLTGLGITNLSIGIVGEYLWRTFELARQKKVYIIDDIVEINKTRKGVT